MVRWEAKLAVRGRMAGVWPRMPKVAFQNAAKKSRGDQAGQTAKTREVALEDENEQQRERSDDWNHREMRKQLAKLVVFWILDCPKRVAFPVDFEFFVFDLRIHFLNFLKYFF